MMAGITPQDLPKDYVINGVEVLEDKILGEGAYGVVKVGKYFGLLCAVKKLKASMFPPGMKQLDQQSELILQSFYNESEKLCQIRHPNVVQLLGVYQDRQTKLPVIVMELMHESLSRLLVRTNSLPLCIEINICHDVAQALAYLHSFKPPIVHRDLSSNNIMISQEYHAKITDLGVAKVARGSLFTWDNTPAPGTLAYMPPEVRKVPADLSPAMDIFALGVNAIQLRTHKFPRPGQEFTAGVLGFSKMVSEKERRKDHIDLMGRTHPLRAIAVECIKDSTRDRPSALKLCDRFEKIRETKEYQESFKVTELRDGRAEDVMQRISDLEHRVEQLKQELADKNAELERVRSELEDERNYTAELLEERARRQIAQGQLELLQAQPGAVVGPLPVPEHPKKKKKKFFKFKRSSKKEKTSEPAPTTPTHDQEQAEDPGDENPSLPDHAPSDPNPTPEEGSPLDISTEMVQESENEIARRSYKTHRLNWYTHQCLPTGLQGSTLRIHECQGKLYLCGGVHEDTSPNKAVYTCSPRNLTRWSKVEAEAPQYYCASAIIRGELVLIGGLSCSDNKCTGNLSSYDSKAKIWVQRFPSLPTPRSSAAAFVCDNYLVVVGGQKEDGEAVNIVEVLHLATQTWESASRLPEKVAGQSVTICGDTVYLVGGSNGPHCLHSVYAASISNIISSCHYFALFVSTDRSGKVWKQLCDCPFAMMTITASGNQLLALGGQEVTNVTSQPAEWIWIFNADENSWSPVQTMPSPHTLCCATVLPDNTLVIIGGNPDFNTIDIAEIS